MEKIIPSIIAANSKELISRIVKVERLFPVLHLDVMDGFFVESHSLDFVFSLPKTQCKFEAHLMVENPLQLVDALSEQVATIVPHVEACKDLQRVIDAIKSNGRKVGFALKPETSVGKIKAVANQIDQVIIMTVDPGKYGATFLPSPLKKIAEVKKLNKEIIVEVDGGINLATISSAARAGADLFACGSFIQNAASVKAAKDQLLQAINKN